MTKRLMRVTFVFCMNLHLFVPANAMEDYVAGDDYRMKCHRQHRAKQVGLCCCYAGTTLCFCAAVASEVTTGCFLSSLLTGVAAGSLAFLNHQDEPCISVRAAHDFLCSMESQDVSAFSTGEMSTHERRLDCVVDLYNYMNSRPECAAYGGALVRERQRCANLRKRIHVEKGERHKQFVDAMSRCEMD